MKLIMLVGQAGAGKTTASEILRKLGFAVLETGDVIRERFYSECQPGETILSFAERLFETEGRDLNVSRYARILYETMLKEPETAGGAIVGLRTFEQVMRLTDLFSESHTLAIYASPERRFSRVKKRQRSDDPLTFIEFVREDFRELAWGLDTVLYNASYFIFNEGTVDELEQQLLSVPFVMG